MPELTRTYLHKHISFHYVNDELRQRIVESYVKRLDPSRSLYLSSEADELKNRLRGTIQDVREAPAKDGEWFEMHITVRGKHVTVAVDGKKTADYVEPESPERPKNMAGRLLSRGTFAFQCHDPGREVHYKDIRVKVLHEGPRPTPARKGPGEGRR